MNEHKRINKNERILFELESQNPKCTYYIYKTRQAETKIVTVHKPTVMDVLFV